MQRWVQALSVCAVLLGAGGCASIFTGSTQTISFHTEPEGADIVVSGKKLGTTPDKLELKRAKNTQVEFRKDGYQSESMMLKTRTNPAIWLNAFFLTYGIPFSSTDASSGAFYKYEPDHYLVPLEPLGQLPLEIQAAPGRGKVVRFVTVNYAELGQEFARGEGEHLESLLKLLHVKDDNRTATLTKLKGLFVEHDDPHDFADAVADEFFQ